MSNVPKFSFVQNSVKSDEELDLRLAETGTGGGNKYLMPGKHEVTITSVEYIKSASDPRWGNFKITYTGTGNKTANEFLSVPFSDVMYKTNAGKESTFPFKKLQRFMKAIGISLKVSNLQEVLNQYFAKPEKSELIGMPLVITVGYEGNYVKWAGKDAAGISSYVLMGQDGNTLLTSSYPSRDAALAAAEQSQIKVEEYSRVISYDVSSTGTKKAAGSW